MEPNRSDESMEDLWSAVKAMPPSDFDRLIAGHERMRRALELTGPVWVSGVVPKGFLEGETRATGPVELVPCRVYLRLDGGMVREGLELIPEARDARLVPVPDSI